MDYKKMISESPLKLVGLKQVLRGIESGDVGCVVIAADSESFIEECVRNAIGTKCVKVLICPTRKELGKAACIDVPAAVVGIA